AERLTTSLQTFAQTADQLPQLVNQQREAAIQQIFAGVATERSNLVVSLASEEVKMRGLLPDMRGTMNAANGVASSANSAIQSLESFMRYVSPPKTNQVPEPANTNQRPFDILDYGTAAGQIGGMAKDLNVLLSSVTQAMPHATQLGQQSAVNIESAMHHVFWLELIAISFFLVGAVLAALLYRTLAARLARHDRPSPAKDS